MGGMQGEMHTQLRGNIHCVTSTKLNADDLATFQKVCNWAPRCKFDAYEMSNNTRMRYDISMSTREAGFDDIIDKPFGRKIASSFRERLDKIFTDDKHAYEFGMIENKGADTETYTYFTRESFTLKQYGYTKDRANGIFIEITRPDETTTNPASSGKVHGQDAETGFHSIRFENASHSQKILHTDVQEFLSGCTTNTKENLERLDLRGTLVEDEIIVTLKQFKNLKILQLDECIKLTDSGIRQLLEIPNLTDVSTQGSINGAVYLDNMGNKVTIPCIQALGKRISVHSNLLGVKKSTIRINLSEECSIHLNSTGSIHLIKPVNFYYDNPMGFTIAAETAQRVQFSFNAKDDLCEGGSPDQSMPVLGLESGSCFANYRVKRVYELTHTQQFALYDLIVDCIDGQDTDVYQQFVKKADAANGTCVEFIRVCVNLNSDDIWTHLLKSARLRILNVLSNDASFDHPDWNEINQSKSINGDDI